MKLTEFKQSNAKNVDALNAKTLNGHSKRNSMEPKTTREHILNLQGHVTGVKREIYHIKKQQEHTHQDIEKTSKKIDWILGLIIAGLAFLASKALFDL